MSVRRLLAGVATTSLVAASAALVAPAHADPTFVPEAADIVGAGSDTSMYALTYLADGSGGVPGYNQGRTTGRIASFDAKTFDATGAQTNSSTVVLQSGAEAVTRPNGSGDGKKLLYVGNEGNGNLHVDFARSSSGLSDAEKSAGLRAFPFAKDTLGMAVAATSNAPASLTEAQIVSIYKGDITNWSQVGGTAGVINPYIPQPGSGTRSFFDGELKRMNGGTAVTLGLSVKETQEHDDSAIKADPNAVAPFSVGRAGLLGTLRIPSGFSAARALYNVVRSADVAKPEITGIFGAGGFVCSPAAASLIADAGFDQLLSAADGGACGVPTQDATTNLATAKISTSTGVVGASTAAGQVTLTATIAGGGALKPQGLVSFYVDGAATAAGTAILTGGKAARSLTGLSAGTHTVVAKFVPTSGSAFNASQSAATAFTVLTATPEQPTPAPTPTPGAVKVTSKIKATFAKAFKGAKVTSGKVAVKLSDGSVAKGNVKVKLGKKAVAVGKLKKGKAVITLKAGRLAKGKNKLTIVFKGSSSVEGSTKKFTIKR